MNQISMRLMNWNGYELAPGLLESYSVSGEGARYRVQLRKSLLDELSLTVEDIIVTLGTNARPTGSFEEEFKNFKKISKYRFEFESSLANHHLTASLAKVEYSIRSEAAGRYHGPFTMLPNSSDRCLLKAERGINTAAEAIGQCRYENIEIVDLKKFSMHPLEDPFLTIAPGYFN